ncbi:nicotinate phosphoribosyltransferase [Sneathiella sp. P13V-1]|uniref:nicotinate phosphoribosyltransferase n=1 Tax=Sneathiella sp. P13V-1 TaxID=2697366 RepID=UPI00187B8242|nr:nicotinate phosphoribosyltransferase [Sneathiella sp. P13V-1]MBE7637129.1 nicotinate phosphoribosyltransferase [Sneathiella sp. P13V-1]
MTQIDKKSDALSAIDEVIAAHTDQYFNRTKQIVGEFGDQTVTYAVFMRRPVIFAPKLMLDWLHSINELRGNNFQIEPCFEEGDWVGAGEPLVYITGSFVDLVDLETLYLQKLGPACVAAYNAYLMCQNMPNSAFLAMDARHCAGSEMAEMMAYAASVGGRIAKKDHNAIGFIGNANDSTAHYFGNEKGLGTMPHALIGYAGSTLRAAEMFVERYPDEALTVLVDYFGKEVTDALAVCARFPELAAEGKIAVRMDTHGGRFVEGLDPAESYAVLERHMPKGIRQYRSEQELKWMVGTGVSAAAIYHMREKLDQAGYDKVRIVASSGFSADKCRVMGSLNAPIDVIGSGSYLPEKWSETYATADIISYDGKPSVKLGREFLLKK